MNNPLPLGLPSPDRTPTVPRRANDQAELFATLAGGSKEPSSGGHGRMITFSFVMFALKRWWKFALPLSLLLSVGSCALVWYFFEPVYKAHAWLRIEDQRPYIVHERREGQLDRFVRTQVQMLRSPIVLDRVLSEPAIARLPELRDEKSPLDWLAAHLQVQSVQNSELFQIVFESSDPKHSADVCNAVLDAYTRTQGDAEVTQTQQIVEILEKEMDLKQRQLERLRQNVRTLVQMAGADPALLSDEELRRGKIAVADPIAPIETQLGEVEAKRTLVEITRRAIENQLKTRVFEMPPDELETGVEEDDQVTRLHQQIEETVLAIESIQDRVRENDPKLADMRTAVAKFEKDLAARQRLVTERLKKRFTETAQAKFQERIDDCNLEIEGFLQLEERLKAQLEDKKKELRAKGHDNLDLEFMLADLERAEQAHKRIADRAEQLKTEMRAPERVREARRASPPAVPEVAWPYKQFMLAGSSCFLLPFLMAVLWEFKVHRIAESRQIAEEMNLPVLGEITTLPVQLRSDREKLPKRWEQYRSIFQESIDYVRTSLLLSDKLTHNQVLAVASAVSREGKSSLASQLAVSLAQAGTDSVLLIDGDLRAPDLHDWLGLPVEPGLANVLAGTAKSKDTVSPTWCTNLHFMPAGKLDRPPQILLGNGNFKRVLDGLRPSYRYIIVDAPPVLPTSDALIIANAADGTLISTMRNVSRTEQLRTTCNRLRSAGANLLGAVLSGVPWKDYAYNYGTYGYQYSYGSTNENYPPIAADTSSTNGVTPSVPTDASDKMSHSAPVDHS